MANCDRNHPVVVSQAAAVFNFVGQALVADVLSGQTMLRVIQATKRLVAATNTNAEAILASNFTPEAQQLIRGHFG